MINLDELFRFHIISCVSLFLLYHFTLTLCMKLQVSPSLPLELAQSSLILDTEGLMNNLLLFYNDIHLYILLLLLSLFSLVMVCGVGVL